MSKKLFIFIISLLYTYTYSSSFLLYRWWLSSSRL